MSQRPAIAAARLAKTASLPFAGQLRWRAFDTSCRLRGFDQSILNDPARFSIAHGGKDRHPFPVPIAVYDHTIGVLKSAVASSRLGQDEQLAAIRRLDEQARRLERDATGPSLPALLAEERRRSHDYGGRSVFGWEPPAIDQATADEA